MARKSTTQAIIVDIKQGDKAKGTSAYLKIAASDGRTYARVIDWVRNASHVYYATWPTGSREIDVSIAYRAMPKSVRDLMRANPNPFAA